MGRGSSLSVFLALSTLIGYSASRQAGPPTEGEVDAETIELLRSLGDLE